MLFVFSVNKHNSISEHPYKKKRQTFKFTPLDPIRIRRYDHGIVSNVKMVNHVFSLRKKKTG